jgi:hypothetical protein
MEVLCVVVAVYCKFVGAVESIDRGMIRISSNFVVVKSYVFFMV